MKIDARHAHIHKALEGLRGETDPARVRDALQATGASVAEVRAVFEALGDSFSAESRKNVERFLSQDGRGGRAVAGGHSVLEVRAHKHSPWWAGVGADPLPQALFAEPARDVEVMGEKFTKDDVLSLLRQVARA